MSTFSHRGAFVGRPADFLPHALLPMSRASPSRPSRAKVFSSAQAIRSGASRLAMWQVLDIHKIIRTGKYPNSQLLHPGKGD